MYAKRAFILQDTRNKGADSPISPASRAASDNESYRMDNAMDNATMFRVGPYAGMIKRQFLAFQLDLKVTGLT